MAHRTPMSGLGDVPIIGKAAQPTPHPPLMVKGPDDRDYLVPVAIALGVAQDAVTAIAVNAAAIVVAELRKAGVLPPLPDEGEEKPHERIV